ncbi:hypothetical protein [Fusobacterium ulcerans]|uniref:hypothetical protein n=1 Tax=Fusobacterium ulcerans TaxID=861 RepID=UPI0027BA9F1A|nr:hypothetical protein [Fusobacterium ulcerans]
MPSTELILSIIGVITGSLALIIDFFNYKFYLPKLIFKQLKNSYILNKEDIDIIYSTKKIAVISAKISNSSAHPITIDEVFIKHSENIKHENDLTFKTPEVIIEKNENVIKYTYMKPNQIAILPLRIEPFDTQYVSFRLPYFDDHKSKFKLVFVTPRKNYSAKVKLSEYHELALARHRKSLKK